MKLWHCKDARSFRVLWALEELGLAYDLVMLPFPPRWHDRSFLEVNPLGTIPFLEHEGVAMTESAAIVDWLGQRFSPRGLAVAADEADFAAYLNWLHHGEATLTFPQTLVLRYGVLERPEKRRPEVVEDYRRWFLARAMLAEQALADGRDWLCAGRFTGADISVGYAVLLARQLGLWEGLGPATRGWWERISGREGFLRAKAVQGGDGITG